MTNRRTPEAKQARRARRKTRALAKAGMLPVFRPGALAARMPDHWQKRGGAAT